MIENVTKTLEILFGAHFS